MTKWSKGADCMKLMRRLLVITVVIFFCSSCAQAEGGNSQPPDYENMKKMMVDMLKTDEGKQAIQELMTDEELKQEIIMEQALVRKTIQDTLTSEQGRKFWQEVMQDPEFAKTFAETIQKENEDILKTLMKDPEYQDMMMDILKDPEMERAALDLMKTKEYRQQVMVIMTDAFESPYFKAQLTELLEQIVQDHLEQPEESGSGGGQEEEGDDT